MGTLLTTSRMDPALAARIEASVSGRRAKADGPRWSPRAVAVWRVTLVLAIATLGYLAVRARRQDRHEVERSRAALLEAVRARSASLAPTDLGSVARAEAWLTRFAGRYEGDLIADELRAPDGLRAALARQAIYVRGPLASFSSHAQLEEAAAASAKDALLLCLVDPPTSRAEKGLLATIHVAYAGGAALEERTAHVRRLNDAIVGLPVLAPAWAARVKSADDSAELGRLRRELDRAPIERAKQAARASLLVFAIDEPGEGGGPTELDGERAHAVRVGVVDLTSAKILLRMRKKVDPSWISVDRRPRYASGLDSCALALDVHEGVRPR